jgi:hypothetical protein
VRGLAVSGVKKMKYHPPWHLMLAAFVGIFGVVWSWWNLRNERREALAATVLFAGMCLWGYAVYGLLLWSFQFCSSAH